MEHQLEAYRHLFASLADLEQAEAALSRVEAKLTTDKRYYGGDLAHRRAAAREIIDHGLSLVRAVKNLLTLI